jgi:catechol 2,3-dioxygenase-like lactoylglutathione lyase family enzyme
MSRRCPWWLIAIAFALVGLTAAAQAAVIAVERISVTVADLDRTERFYRDGLGFVTVERHRSADPSLARLVGVENAATDTLLMRLGRDEVEFVAYRRPGRPYPADSQSPDLWFQHFAVIVSDMDAAYRRLQRVGAAAITRGGPQTLPAQNGHVRAFKFRDPDGHPLELLYFPAGQGRALWHRPAEGAIFLGIDHSAIGVTGTAASNGFYRGLLGMSAAYEVTNRGPTQEALDAARDAVVRITGLRPSSPDGPGIEFLDYRAPPGGRPAPVDTRSDDVVHVHLVLLVADFDEQIRALEENHVRFVSAGVVTFADGSRAAMVRDPDGHALLLEDRPFGP